MYSFAKVLRRARHRVICICLLVFVGLSSAVAFGGQDVDVECGPKCLAVVMHAFGHEISYDELLRDLGDATSEGYSLASLHDYVRRCGLEASLVKTSVANLKRRSSKEEFACICWIGRDHFVICSGIEDDNEVHVIDPPSSYAMPAVTFCADWSGEALLIAKSPLMDESNVNWRIGWLSYLLVPTIALLGFVIYWRLR